MEERFKEKDLREREKGEGGKIVRMDCVVDGEKGRLKRLKTDRGLRRKGGRKTGLRRER